MKLIAFQAALLRAEKEHEEPTEFPISSVSCPRLSSFEENCRPNGLEQIVQFLQPSWGSST
jgi:hypothetical protein